MDGYGEDCEGRDSAFEKAGILPGGKTCGGKAFSYSVQAFTSQCVRGDYCKSYIFDSESDFYGKFFEFYWCGNCRACSQPRDADSGGGKSDADLSLSDAVSDAGIMCVGACHSFDWVRDGAGRSWI